MYFNKKTKKFISVVLIVLAAFAVFAAFENKDDEYDRAFTTWTVGGINAEGLYDETIEGKMVSGLIEVNDGIKIVPKFTAGGSYDVLAFNENGVYISKDLDLASGFTTTLADDQLDENIYYIRIVYQPDDDNGKITELELLKYLTEIKVYTKTTNNTND
jgi:hypothetical protein